MTVRDIQKMLGFASLNPTYPASLFDKGTRGQGNKGSGTRREQEGNKGSHLD